MIIKGKKNRSQLHVSNSPSNRAVLASLGIDLHAWDVVWASECNQNRNLTGASRRRILKLNLKSIFVVTPE
jgi:hypothetical protein